MHPDPALVAIWTRGWALTRGCPPPAAVPGGARIEVGWPDQKARYVFAAHCPGLAQAARATRDPLIFLKVTAAPEAVRPLLPPRWSASRTGFLMRRGALDPALADIPSGYRLALTREDEIFIATVTAPGGEAAGRGRMGIVEKHAIHDRIRTEEGHRRLGLGRAVMAALGNAALDHGARHGLLVATLDGQALYTGLGWETLSPYTTAVIPA